MTFKTQEYDFDRDYRFSATDKALMARGEAIADAFAALTGVVRTVAAKLYAPIKTWAVERATRDELMSLDDRTLADIGLTRGDIPQVASGLWAPENRLAQVRAARVIPASNVNNRPQVAA
ncbi:MAG TPA: DUF1127 domain-containing protein [Alphaproteobacteria bacterium]|nr:DUF1127 domain-containing protein [Alphaproteobacteria bacterium]